MPQAVANSLQPWFWQTLPLDGRSGSEVFEQLFSTSAISVLLESPYPNPEDQPQARYSICAGPPRNTANRPHIWTPALGDIFPCLGSRLASGSSLRGEGVPSQLPFVGGWLGWLGFDAAWEIELLPWRNPEQLPFPVAFWYEPAVFAVLDHETQSLWLATSDPDTAIAYRQKLETERPVSVRSSPQLASSLQFLWSKEAFIDAVNRAQAYIHAGDIFQTNLSLRFQATTQSNGWAIYRRLQTINPSPFASYWRTPWGELISCSPERLLHKQGSQLQTRPIAGTRSRGVTPESDQRLAQELQLNAKELAEHIMLVDLERNDLGRVCQWGTVEVDELLVIERYSHVMHLVSNVRGELRSDLDVIAAIKAVFPGGTITGCPKVRCLEIIEELEPLRRSLFYGSCGYLDYRGNCDLNILIRTLLLTSQDSAISNIWGQVGAGIVADSQPVKEWEESLQKAQAQLQALGLS
ncbi:MAG: anthranilate synthase component I [Cyanobacteria bacterium P01_H01_bin.15]